jgi:hypothetical protein
MQPTIGRIVHYKLNEGDVAEIDRRFPQKDAMGAYLRNPVSVGQVLPARVVAVFDATAGTSNLKADLDGYGEYWATSRAEGDEPGQWSWPPRA